MSKKIKVLYVDDEAINLLLFERIFAKKYTVDTADSGKQGLEKLSSDPDINIVISDMRMPDMDGLEFITQAKEQFPDVYFFILTGFSITDKIMEALDNKLINRYFQKPFEMNEIDLAIAHALHKAKE